MSARRRHFLARAATGASVAMAGLLATAPAHAAAPNGACARSREVSVLDFMSDAMRNDALSCEPSLDHSDAMQKAFDSGAVVVHLPGGCVFRLTRPLTIARPVRVSGGGEMRFVAGIANAAAITVTKDGCAFDGVFLTNPGKLQSASGERNVGILFRASLGSVMQSTLRWFQNGIQVESTGEYHDFIIANNRVLDCIGAGGGPTRKASSDGEDRGDGITTWGCTATISGNLVTAMAGQDCRVGIHMEGLASYHTDSFPLQDNLCTVVGNVVRGTFRRSIVTEDVNNATISGNVCEGATWWGIAIVRSQSCAVTGNAVVFDRAASDQSGAAWGPMHAGIAVYGGALQCLVADNTIDLTRGHAEAGILLQGVDADNAVATEQRATCDGTARVRLQAGNPSIRLGQRITGAGVPADTFVVSVAQTALVASKPVGAGATTLVFKWHERGQGTAVTDNSVLCNAADGAVGIWAQYQDSPTLSGNRLRQLGAHGIYGFDISDPVINGNSVRGQGSTGHGIRLESSNTSAVVTGNSVDGFDGTGGCGIGAVQRNGGVVSGNVVRRCTTGIALPRCTGMAVTGNSAMACGVGYADGRGGGMVLANNAGAG